MDNKPVCSFVHEENEDVLFVAFSHDAHLVLTGTRDKSYLWDASKGKRLHILDQTEITSGAFSPCDKMLLTSSWSTLTLWDTITGKILFAFQHSHVINSVAFSQDGKKVSIGADDNAYIFDVLYKPTVDESGDGVYTVNLEKKHLLPHSLNVNSVSFSPNSQQLLTGTGNTKSGDPDLWSAGIVALWDANTGKELRIFEHSEPVTAVTFSPDGRQVLTSSWDLNCATLWNINTGEKTRNFYHNSVPKSVEFSADGSRMLSRDFDDSINIWDVSTGKRTMKSSSDRIFNSVAFSPSADRLLVGCPGKHAEIWDIETLLMQTNANSSITNQICNFPESMPKGILQNLSNAEFKRHLQEINKAIPLPPPEPDRYYEEGYWKIEGWTSGKWKISDTERTKNYYRWISLFSGKYYDEIYEIDRRLKLLKNNPSQTLSDLPQDHSITIALISIPAIIILLCYNQILLSIVLFISFIIAGIYASNIYFKQREKVFYIWQFIPYLHRFM